MNNYKMVLSYDGTGYTGWQKQGNTKNTIQEKLEHILGDIAQCETEVFGSGRTDAGTHAWGQVANFHMAWSDTTEALREALNRRLPEDIAVLSLEEVPPRFHSRLNAVGKTYVYRIWNSIESPVFDRKYVWVVEEPLDIIQMQKAAKYFLGKHDFKNFCSNKRMKKSTVREIYRVDVAQEKNEIRFVFTGSGFLYNMIRIMIGTLVEVGEGKRQAESIPLLFGAESREETGFTAPAKGLVLAEVFYDKRW